VTPSGAQPRLRFELIPLRGAEEQAARLPRGATVTVTSSPRRGLEPTLELCERLTAPGFNAVPHISARQVVDHAHLTDVMARVHAMGIREVFVVGGDGREPAGPFDSSLSLLRAMADSDQRFERVGVAGYPERHPLIDNPGLIQALADKQPFASYVVTQICFDPAAITAWIDRIRQAGVDLPVYVGMPGVVNRAKLLEITLRIGVGDSLRFVRKHDGLVARLVGRTAYRPDALIAGLSPDLAQPGAAVAGIHINTFNQVEPTMRWVRQALARNGWLGGPAGEEESLA
jgi:methylenetetrahydrofolate reductase (NADPH)